MVIGLFIDLWNWQYTRKRIQLLREAKEIMRVNRLKISLLGVLYTVVEMDKSIPEHLTDRFLINKLKVVDDALVSINLDGLMHFTHELYGETETTWYILVKFVPNMPHWTWKYFLSSLLVGSTVVYVAARLIIYYGLWTKFVELIKPVLNALY